MEGVVRGSYVTPKQLMGASLFWPAYQSPHPDQFCELNDVLVPVIKLPRPIGVYDVPRYITKPRVCNPVKF